MNAKLAKLYRRLIGLRGHQETQYGGTVIKAAYPERVGVIHDGEGAVELIKRRDAIYCTVKAIPAAIEGYFWKPQTPAFDGVRNVRMPVTCRGARGQYRRAKAYHRAKVRLDSQSVL